MFPPFCLCRFYTLRRYPRILGREFDADAPSARCLCREGGGAAAEEGIKHCPAFRDDAHELRHELNRLACEMDFFGAVYRVPEDAGQALACVPLKTSLGAIDDILGVTPELTGHRTGRGLMPDDEPPPHPACGLHGVGHAWELPPVREDKKRSPVAGDAPALAEPLRHPPCERALILGVAEHGRITLFCPRLLVFDDGVGLFAGKRDRAAAIRRIGDDRVDRFKRKARKYGKGVAVIDGVRFVLKKTDSFGTPTSRRGRRGSCGELFSFQNAGGNGV